MLSSRPVTISRAAQKHFYAEGVSCSFLHWDFYQPVWQFKPGILSFLSFPETYQFPESRAISTLWDTEDSMQYNNMQYNMIFDTIFIVLDQWVPSRGLEPPMESHAKFQGSWDDYFYYTKVCELPLIFCALLDNFTSSGPQKVFKRNNMYLCDMGGANR